MCKKPSRCEITRPPSSSIFVTTIIITGVMSTTNITTSIIITAVLEFRASGLGLEVQGLGLKSVSLDPMKNLSEI